MNKECANCGNERIMLCPFCEHDYTDQSTLTTLRAQLAEVEKQLADREETIEVLRKEIKDWTRAFGVMKDIKVELWDWCRPNAKQLTFAETLAFRFARLWNDASEEMGGAQ